MPVLGRVIGALHVVDAGRNRDCAAQVRPGAGQASEIGQCVEREVDLARQAAKFVAADAFAETIRKAGVVDEAQERQPRVDARRHHPRPISSPFSRTTPCAWLSRTMMPATAASARISAPASRAAAAMALEIAPVPPRASPHERNAPSISPM